MMNKKAELSPVAIILLIVAIGSIVFFGIKYFVLDEPEVIALSDVAQLNDSVTSIGIQLVNQAGGVNLTDGSDLSLRNPVTTVSQNNTNLTLIKVIYPNRTLTPGDIMSTNLTEICAQDYPEEARDVSQSTRETVYKLYKLNTNQPEGAFQLDHLVPLGIGGSNEITNLWPQPVSPRPGYKEKDILERYYHTQVCAGKMDLREAQAMMAQNWFQGYIKAKESGGIK